MTDHSQNMDSEKSVSNVVKIDEERIKGHLDRIVRGTVEETLNSRLVWLPEASQRARP